MKRILFCLILLTLGSSTAQAGPPQVTISDARVRWLPGDLPMAGYFRITNDATQPLYLVGASSPVFGMTMLHRSVEKDGVSRMESADRITVEPGQTVGFAPGGYHLMLMNRKQDVQTGQELPVTLEFSDGETFTAPFKVTGTQDE